MKAPSRMLIRIRIGNCMNINITQVRLLSIFSVVLLAGFSITAAAQQNQGAVIGGYGELHYNDVISDENGPNTPGTLDFHRFILFAGYNFNDWISFRSELELEHTLLEAEDSGEAEGGEVALEQAYVDLRVKPTFGVRAGLLLVPVGIINPVHEPPTFHGVERPNVEKYIIPTTWRESGIGIYGNFPSGLSYQLYGMAGLAPNDITGSNGIRGARQNGFESSVGNFAFTGRLDYNVNLNLKVSASYFFSTIDHEVDDGEAIKIGALDGATFNMVEGHFQYTKNRLEARGLLVYSSISDAENLNLAFGNDAGSSQVGGYIELAYDILPSLTDQPTEHKLFAFGRFESYDTHASTDVIPNNPENLRNEYTFGFTYKPSSRVAFKADYQFLNSAGIKEIPSLLPG